jgi:hypothetical protein
MFLLLQKVVSPVNALDAEEVSYSQRTRSLTFIESVLKAFDTSRSCLPGTTLGY